MRRQGGSKRLQNSPKHKGDKLNVRTSEDKKYTTISDRLKCVENKLRGLLVTLDSRSMQDTPSTSLSTEAGGTIEAIERIAQKISTAVNSETRKNAPTDSVRATAVELRPVATATSTINEQINNHLWRKTQFVTLAHNSNIVAPFAKFYILSFNEQGRKFANPYAIINRIKEMTGERPKKSTGNNKSSFTIEASTQAQAQLQLSIAKIENFPCKVELHPRLNFSKRHYLYL